MIQGCLPGPALPPPCTCWVPSPALPQSIQLNRTPGAAPLTSHRALISTSLLCLHPCPCLCAFCLSVTRAFGFFNKQLTGPKENTCTLSQFPNSVNHEWSLGLIPFITAKAARLSSPGFTCLWVVMCKGGPLISSEPQILEHAEKKTFILFKGKFASNSGCGCASRKALQERL